MDVDGIVGVVGITTATSLISYKSKVMVVLWLKRAVPFSFKKVLNNVDELYPPRIMYPMVILYGLS